MPQSTIAATRPQSPNSLESDLDLPTCHIHFLGGGHMANGIIGGLIHRGIPATQISVTEPNAERAQVLREAWNITVSQDAPPADTEVIVLAIKPQVFPTALPQLASTLKAGTLVISVAAGIHLHRIQQYLGSGFKLARAMPNMPALIRCGATGLFGDSTLTDADRALADNIMRSVGTTLWVESEDLIDAVTAVSGSGPAYFFLLMEAMTEAGITLGLSREHSQALTIQTALGAATLASHSQHTQTPEHLRQQVTSPGGTTAAAINHLIDHQFPDLITAALTRARDRAIELAR
ncbi:MAG: pyrroline-5-carboxylate reductase [Gammaproteobacteria bacterium]|jgi:pyrroline-5-carboxylate reductase